MPIWDRLGGLADELAEMIGMEKEAAILHFAKEIRRMPVGRFGTEEEVAPATLLFGSDVPWLVTGTEYRANAGTLMNA